MNDGTGTQPLGLPSTSHVSLVSGKCYPAFCTSDTEGATPTIIVSRRLGRDSKDLENRNET